MVKVYTRYDRPVTAGVTFDEREGKTHQEFKDECDINRIMRQAVRRGSLPPVVNAGTYGDFSNAGDYQAAQDVLIRAKEQFASLPSAVRDRFQNDPKKFLDWIHSKDTKIEEANSLGLLTEEASARVVAAAKAAKDAEAARLAAVPPAAPGTVVTTK